MKRHCGGRGTLPRPLNARRFNADTPCVKGELRCYDCDSPAPHLQGFTNAMVQARRRRGLRGGSHRGGPRLLRDPQHKSRLDIARVSGIIAALWLLYFSLSKTMFFDKGGSRPAGLER